MISAIIVDDKPTNIDILLRLISRYCPQVEVLAASMDTDSAYESITTFKPDLVFLDIEMPGGDGFSLLRRFQPVLFEVIFVTAYSNYAVQAFREKALDYLLKPIDISALQEAVARAEGHRRLQQPNHNHGMQQLLQHPIAGNKIPIPVQDGYLYISTNDISHCEGAGSYTHFYLTDGKKLVVSMRLKECEEILPSTVFFRVHHSYIVNLHQVIRYIRGRGGLLQMRDGSQIDVSASRRDAFLEVMKRQ